LNEEWVEFCNGTDRTLSINGCSIAHYTFTQECVKEGEQSLATFSAITLARGSSVRVHSGSGVAYVEAGRLVHVYAGRDNFVWNNKCGDTLVLRAADGALIDWAYYKGGVANGVILKRVPGTNTLTVTGSVAA